MRNIKLDGQAYFRNRFLVDNTKGVFDELKEHFYTQPAAIPAMTWIDSIAPSVPANPVFIPLDKGVKLSWKASTDNSSVPVYYRIYASNTYPIDITQASNLIEIRTDSTQYIFCPEVPWQERIYWAVTAVDRYGNESQPLEMNQPFTTSYVTKQEKR